MEAARIMVAEGVKRLPVVDEAERLVGIVSRGDLAQPFDDRNELGIVQETLDGHLAFIHFHRHVGRCQTSVRTRTSRDISSRTESSRRRNTRRRKPHRPLGAPAVEPQPRPQETPWDGKPMVHAGQVVTRRALLQSGPMRFGGPFDPLGSRVAARTAPGPRIAAA